MLIDSHAHLNFKAFEEDREKIIKECLEKNIWMINVGSRYDTSQKAVEIAQEYEQGVYAAVGLHPIHLDTGLVKMKVDTEEIEFKSREENFDYEKYKNLALGKNLECSAYSKKLSQSKKVVAIGETGFDYYWRPKTTAKKELFKQKQKGLFLKHLQLAKELNLPVIFHCRMAYQDLIKTLLENFKIRPEKAIAHSFVGNIDELKKILDFGYYIGFNGIIFKTIEGINFEQIIRETPMEKLLIETDCPYLAPPPFQNERNTPLYLKYIVEKIARIKKKRPEEISEITTKNAKELFNI